MRKLSHKRGKKEKKRLYDKWTLAKKKLRIPIIQVSYLMKPMKKEDHRKEWMLQSSEGGDNSLWERRDRGVWE